MSALTDKFKEERFIDVTVRFRVPVTDLKHYDAETIEQAARNLREWYDDGTCDVAPDMAEDKACDITTAAVTRHVYHNDRDRDVTSDTE